MACSGSRCIDKGAAYTPVAPVYWQIGSTIHLSHVELQMRTVALYEMLFGLLTIIGGIIGYATAGSVISLVAGIAAGLALLFSGFTMQKGSRTGLYIALVVTLVLLGHFGRNFFFGDAAFMPAGLMSVLGIISLLLLVLLLVQPKERKRIF